MRQPPSESIWGNINTCAEIALNVYMIYAEHGKGIMVMGDEETSLSNNALKMGSKEEDGNIYFDENTQDIPIYEILQQRMAKCKAIEISTMKQIKEIERDGKLLLTDYFGECSPPSNGKDKVRNGIYFTKDPKGENFAVHEAVAEYFLSPFATDFAKKEGDYYFFDERAVAIPLFELKNVFTEVEALVISEDSLYSTLNANFSTYVAMYNGIVPKDSRIPMSESVQNLFLSSQLNHADNEPDYDEEFSYGEEVDDYGLEP